MILPIVYQGPGWLSGQYLNSREVLYSRFKVTGMWERSFCQDSGKYFGGGLSKVEIFWYNISKQYKDSW